MWIQKTGVYVRVQVERTLPESDLRIPTENYLRTYLSSDNSVLFNIRFHVSQKLKKIPNLLPSEWSDVFFKLKMHQNRFRPGPGPGPRWGSLWRSPELLVGWGRGLLGTRLNWLGFGVKRSNFRAVIWRRRTELDVVQPSSFSHTVMTLLATFWQL